jgi:predicted secreted protein
MRWTSALAIYFLFLSFSAFALLPFSYARGQRGGDGERIPGQAESAPAKFDAKWHFVVAALLAALLFGLFYANYVEGWITVQDLDFFNPPEATDNLVG